MAYNTFKELYEDGNQLLIEEEFAKRERFRYEELMTALTNTAKNKEGAAWANIDNARICQALMHEKELWESVKNRIQKEMYELRIPTPLSPDRDTMRNKVDEMVSYIVFPLCGDRNRYRGYGEEYNNRLRAERTVVQKAENLINDVFQLGFKAGAERDKYENC